MTNYHGHITGESSDGDIDGKGIVIISGFISLRVIFQCKRYNVSYSKINMMSKLNLFALIVLLLITSVSVAQEYRYIKGKTYEGIANISTKDYRSKSIQPFISTDIDIARLEKKIPAQLADLVKKYKPHEYANCNCDIEKNLSKYKRIYYGMCFYGEMKLSLVFI